jgi:ABC-type glycerol-3-phosphate transport system substrate-binding protein
MLDANTRMPSRRQYIKAAGGALAASSVAGCLGGGGGGANVETIQYWDTFNVQSQSARETVERMVSEFEEENDVTVELNLSGFGQMAGSEWITTFEQGEYPVIFTGDQIVAGRFEEAGYIEPFEEWSGQLSSETRDGINWMLDGPIDQAIAWMGEHPDIEKQVYTFPVGLVPQDPLQVRVDHMEAAGLDPESDFPPEDYDHLVEVATTLTNDGPGDWGLQLHGHPFDWYTFIEPYTNAMGAHKGEAGYFAEDYRSVNYDTDTWLKVVSDTIALYREHEVSGPQTPSIPDEETVPLFLDGKVSMSPIEPMNYPEYLSRAPDLMEAGDIRYGGLWDQPSGMNNAMLTYGLAITSRPDGVDEATWERKQELAVKFAEKWFSSTTQTSLFTDTGFVPVRRDLWERNAEQLPYNDASRAFATLTDMVANKSRGVHTSHPMYITASSDMGSLMGKGYNGELSPEQVCKQGAEAGNKVLDDYWSSR